MTYYKEKKKYKPILEIAKRGECNGVSTSPAGNILLSHFEYPGCNAECLFGWERERVTHLLIIPNKNMMAKLESGLSHEDFRNWLTTELYLLFNNRGVPLPPLIVQSKDNKSR